MIRHLENARHYPLELVVPDPNGSEAEVMRFYHLDLEALGSERLWAENQIARFALAEVIRRGIDNVIVYGAGWHITMREWLWRRVDLTQGRRS